MRTAMWNEHLSYARTLTNEELRGLYREARDAWHRCDTCLACACGKVLEERVLASNMETVLSNLRKAA